ncbi:LLM class flavin-dependent oxidoreductase [Miltoncostaea marina]|uniref:LLM class flavin-dependent oxidoreductase n=1 Tax=Miltoncostaea marina TaxID=2843215 RepID=UPI001C3C32D8|nr:LLM class flavin-dependent oxidoreductase [Miltoncostaea marina]
MPPPLAIPVDAQLVGHDPAELAAFARAAEGAGLSRLWAPELHRSSTIPLAVAAAATERIGLGTGVALAFTRSPMVLALEALDLDELSGGRLALGLGAGVRRLNATWHAGPYEPPVRRMREMVAAVRELVAALAAGRDARSPGELYDIDVRGLRRGHPAPRGAVPVWLAAVLPGMTRLAGRVADGFLDHPVTSPEWLRERLLPELRAGAERAGRPVPEVAAALICAVDDDDPAAAVRAAAGTVGFYATVRTYEPMFAEHGFAARLPAIRAAFADGDAERLADAVGEDMTAAFAAAGTAAQVRERAGALEPLAGRLWATPPHHGQDAAGVRRWQAGILGALGDAG